MPAAFALESYSTLADSLFKERIKANELPQELAPLSPLTETLLEQLAQAAEEAANISPRRAWAFTLVADCAARLTGVPLLEARAAWHLGRAYNHWGQPLKAAEAITRARRGFESLGDPGWLAACEWQFNHLAWTQPNVGEAAHRLGAALVELEQAGLWAFAVECRLSLSYAQILRGDFARAQENLETCKQIFTAQPNPLNLARCWLNEASSLRRQGNYLGAYAKLTESLSAFQKCNAPLDIAKAHYQLGLWYFLSGRDYPQAVSYFEQAAAAFLEQKMNLWWAVCENGLAQVDIHNGSPAPAIQKLERARAVFIEHEVSSLIADNHNDSGQFELLLGNLSAGLEHFRQAEKRYQSLGFSFAAANVLANYGYASALLGYYQEALNTLEQAQKRFQDFGDPGRLGMAGCALYLARIWTELNQYATAHEYLQQAEAEYLQIGQNPMLALAYNQRAQVLAMENRFEEAARMLEKALENSRRAGLSIQIVLAERRLGEMLARAGSREQALALLTQAESQFCQMGLVIEQAASLAALGNCQPPADAAQSFRTALALSQGTLPEIDSRCHAGLAALTEETGDLPSALSHYRAAAQTIAQLRQSFWQPALAGSYLRAVKTTLDSAVEVAAQLRSAGDALEFIEGSKAQALTRQLSTTALAPLPNTHPEIHNLWSEIQALQAQIREVYDPSPWSRAVRELKPLQEKLIIAVQEYDKRLAALERASTQPSPDINPKYFDYAQRKFDLPRFRAEACSRLGEAWLALNYYLTGETVTICLVSPNKIEILTSPVSARLEQALAICAKSQRRAPEITLRDLDTLGQALLPSEIEPYLSSPNSHLIISPHRDLHSVPWAALRLGWASQYLVERCTPHMAPSLQFLQVLWQRAAQSLTSERLRGLLLGISDFQGKRPSLPAVAQEIWEIHAQAHPASQALLNADATRERLLAQKSSLPGLGFFHIASHINHDPRTGRLSSLALYDQEITLDWLRNLAPLPGLVTLSACGGAQSLLYEGDEHVGMASACLLAGANTVLGSLWPLLDFAAAETMPHFYRHFFAGQSPAGALSQTQRAAIQAGQELHNWAGLACMGV